MRFNTIFWSFGSGLLYLGHPVYHLDYIIIIYYFL